MASFWPAMTSKERRKVIRAAVEKLRASGQDVDPVTSSVGTAIDVEKAGTKVDSKAKRELELPDELTQILAKDEKLAKAWTALTPGRQRGYVLHFASAKQSQTRTSRIEKCIPRILAGQGMNDH